MAEAERLERSRPVPHWTGGLANRCHTFRRRFRTGTRATIRTPGDGFGSHLLSQEHPSINLAESEGIEPSRFITVALFSRQFPDHSRPLSVIKELGRPGEIRTLTHEALVPKTSVYTVPPPAYWSTDRDSNSVRVGFETTASTASAFSAELKS